VGELEEVSKVKSALADTEIEQDVNVGQLSWLVA